MIRINLLPIRQMKKRLRSRNEILFFLVCWVALLTFLATVTWSMDRKVVLLQTKISELNNSKTKYNKIIAEIKQLEQDKQKISAKIDIIKKLKSTSQIAVHLLDEIAKATPPDSIWLNSLKQSANTVSITGVALDNTRLAEYMDRLSASQYFSGANLGSSSLTTISGQDLKSFSLSLGIQEPEKEKVQADQDKQK